MSNLDTVIDFGSNNLRLGVFGQSSEIIYTSNIKITDVLENKNLNKYLNKIIRDAEKQLSTHLVDINVLYDSSEFNLIDLSIRKSFDQPTSILNYYKHLVEEANFVVSENNFKDQILHIVIDNVIVDNNKKLETIFDDIKTNSLILDLKFICLKKSSINNLSNKFKENNLNILNIYCSSYVKSMLYNKKFENKNNLIFLDIGYERSSALFFYDNKFQFLNSIPIGGNNITKDISKVLKLDLNYSENLKIEFNKDENDTYLNKNSINEINLYSELIKKNISIDLLKQIIEARVNEIIKLSITQNNFFKNNICINKPSIILIGNGSKLLSHYLNIDLDNDFSELIVFEENDSMICEAGIIYHKSNDRFLIKTNKRPKKTGFFEKFFNLFSK